MCENSLSAVAVGLTAAQPWWCHFYPLHWAVNPSEHMDDHMEACPQRRVSGIKPTVDILVRASEISTRGVSGFRLKQGEDGAWCGSVADTLVFDSSGGHYLRGERALMGILCSRQARASAPSSLAAINKGKYASLDQDGAGDLQSSQFTVARGVKRSRLNTALITVTD